MLPLAQIETLKQLKDKSLFFWTIILPIVSIILLIELFTTDSTNKTLVASQSVTGMSVFFSTFIIISIVISFVKDREKGIVSRLASTPLKPYNFFLGKSIPFLVITFMQILLLSVLGIFLYDIEINNFPAYMWVVVLISLLVTSWELPFQSLQRLKIPVWS